MTMKYIHHNLTTFGLDIEKTVPELEISACSSVRFELRFSFACGLVDGSFRGFSTRCHVELSEWYDGEVEEKRTRGKGLSIL